MEGDQRASVIKKIKKSIDFFREKYYIIDSQLILHAKPGVLGSSGGRHCGRFGSFWRIV